MLGFITSFLSTPAFIIGFVALVGLIAMRRAASDVIKGTLKTILGFMILQAGSGIIVDSLVPFSQMFEDAFGLEGVIAEDNAIAAAVQAVLSMETSFILVFGFLLNLVFARLTPLKYIFLTGHMMFSMAATIAIVLDQMGVSGWAAVGVGSVIQGVTSVVFPALAQPFVRKVTGNDNVAFGFYGSSLVWATGWIGGKLGNKERTTEDVKISPKLDFLKEMSVLMSIVMVLVYGVAAAFASPELVAELSGEQPAPLMVVLNALTFVVGILILLQGVRMFLGELIPAFKGISEKLVPGAKPALDVPIFYAFAPTATTIGFIMAVVGGLVATVLSTFTTVVVLPSVIGLFFMGAAAGVFGNAMGGRRGAVIAGFLLGFLFQFIVAVAYPLVGLDDYGITGLWFASPDAILVVALMRAVGLLFGV
ncbi:PTS ascorbate transporter subunit IIC [Georgenia sp. TF02-10]|uniref:PTS ascorbate transporter subunit IIC n=1 Tax=Georgenia sp. TF02-10 TaxID=2917725 RepID=UPI001FA7956F|nr:PTS ascorbate transporter subunit IIC [Georgenia sp. TF02-10]UNX54615.1 PTS ascorbate transporter subunit IIC [Georgenia sp. TF02-10]